MTKRDNKNPPPKPPVNPPRDEDTQDYWNIQDQNQPKKGGK